MPKAPKCPKCGSSEIIYPGHCSFHWRNGEWVMQRGSQHMATDHGAPMFCQSCSTPLACDDINEPMEGIEVETNEMQLWSPMHCD